MKRAWFSLFAALIFTCIAGVANAGILIEPYVGYGAGAMTAKLGASSGANGLAVGWGTTGTTIGGRLGYAAGLVGFGLFAALDYGMSSGNTTLKTDETNGAGGFVGSPFENTTAWAVVGAKLVLVRVYAGVAIQGETKLKVTGNESAVSGGSGMKAGVSFTGLPLVNLNLEYITHSYAKYKATGVDESIAAANTFTEAKVNNLLFSVSLPFDL